MRDAIIIVAIVGACVVGLLGYPDDAPDQCTEVVYLDDRPIILEVYDVEAERAERDAVAELAAAMVAWARAAEDHDASDRAAHYARIAVEAVRQRPGVVDAYTLAALGWVETRWRSHLVSDAGACGWLQGLPLDGRPTCAEFAEDDLRMAIWALDHLDERRGDAGVVRPCRYLGACETEQAVDYERRVWRAANFMRRYGR